METLLARREMLKEYFSLEIDANGYITSLPLLLKDYTPNLDKLPLLLMRLGPQVRTIIPPRPLGLDGTHRSTGIPSKSASRVSCESLRSSMCQSRSYLDRQRRRVQTQPRCAGRSSMCSSPRWRATCCRRRRSSTEMSCRLHTCPSSIGSSSVAESDVHEDRQSHQCSSGTLFSRRHHYRAAS